MDDVLLAKLNRLREERLDCEPGSRRYTELSTLIDEMLERWTASR